MPAPNPSDPDFFETLKNTLASSQRGFPAPPKIVECIEAAVTGPYEEGIAVELGVEPRELSDEEIRERLFLAMINEGARALDEGIALRASDIDLVYVCGYGMAAWRGGPMFHANTLGLEQVLAGIEKYRARYGDRYWTPAPTLERLAAAGGRF